MQPLCIESILWAHSGQDFKKALLIFKIRKFSIIIQFGKFEGQCKPEMELNANVIKTALKRHFFFSQKIFKTVGLIKKNLF